MVQCSSSNKIRTRAHIQYERSGDGPSQDACASPTEGPLFGEITVGFAFTPRDGSLPTSWGY